MGFQKIFKLEHMPHRASDDAMMHNMKHDSYDDKNNQQLPTLLNFSDTNNEEEDLILSDSYEDQE